MKAIVVDNFFDNFKNIEESLKKIPLYNLKQYNKKFPRMGDWPGYRSGDLSVVHPILHNLLIKEIFDKFKIDFFSSAKFIEIKSVLHLRTLDSGEDWIHKDTAQKTLLIYLSKTNLESGTFLYEEDANPSTIVKFIQNRALLFDCDIKHRSISNYGNNIDDGRLTLNCFINSKK